MDPLTHTLSGVAIGNALYRGRLGPKAAAIMAVAANLPDIDAVVHLTGAHEAILMRRTFGHSLLLIPLWSGALVWLLRRWKWAKAPLPTLFGMCILGSTIHLFLDLINSFGVVPLWPLRDWRPELSIVFIVDLALIALLAAPPLLCALRPLRHRLISLSRGSLGLAAAYLLLCGSARSMALLQLSREAARLGVRPDFLYAFPEPFGPHRWRGVLRAGGIYRLYLVRPFSGALEPRGEAETLLDDPRVRRVRELPLGRRLSWFFKAPVWTARSAQVPGQPGEVSVYDLRFLSLVLAPRRRWGIFEFRFQVDANGAVARLPAD